VASGEMQCQPAAAFGAVRFPVMLACANVANLQTGSGDIARREMALAYLSAPTRARVLRQLLTEGVSSPMLGEALGVLLAFAITEQ